MDHNYISTPTQFEVLEGNFVDFNKTFDLSCSNNDEMLRLYLYKAGLSDKIDFLSPEQRRSFIYDIIKSNKKPGNWMPSFMGDLRKGPTTPMYHHATKSTNSSSPLRSLMSYRLGQPINVPSTPTTDFKNKNARKCEISDPTNFKHISGNTTQDITNKNVRKCEISRPTNFMHVSGGMTRDITKMPWVLPKY